MTRLDPFTQRIPAPLLADRSIEPWARYLDRHLQVSHKIVQRLSNKEFTNISIDTGDTIHTTTTHERIICINTGSLVITLNTGALDGEIVKIKRRDGPVEIIGTIDGQAVAGGRFLQ